MNKNKSDKILVHLHLYYHNQIDFFIDKLQNINGCIWDLYVTVCEDNKESTEKILQFKPDAKIIKVENLGYDIWPFIQVCRMVNLDDYDYVLKIHTKNYREKAHLFKEANVKIKGFSWRNDLVNALIGSKSIFKKNIKILNKKNAGIIVSKNFLFPLKKRAEDTYLLENLKSMLNIESSYKYYCAGTMFIIRSELLKPLVTSDINAENFIIEEQTYTGDNGKFVHAVERIFTVLADSAGYNICAREAEEKIFKDFLQKIFSIKNSKDKSHKILTVLGLSLSLRKNYNNKNNIAVFASYDANNVIQDYVIYYLKELKKVANKIIFVSDCEYSPKELEKIKKYVYHTICEKHGEYDFGSYKRGYLYAKENGLLNNCKGLILCNDSCYGPLYPLSNMFISMSNKTDKDFWGVTMNPKGCVIDGDEVIYGQDIPHIQSYFIVLKSKVINSDAFDNFMKSVKKEDSKHKIIFLYEEGLTKTLEENGFKWDVYCKLSKKKKNAQIHKFKQLIIKNKSPFLKTSICRYQNEDIKIYPEDIYFYINKKTKYNFSLIFKDLKNKRIIKDISQRELIISELERAPENTIYKGNEFLEKIFSVKNDIRNLKHTFNGKVTVGKKVSFLFIKFRTCKIHRFIDLLVDKYKKHYENDIAIAAIVKNEAPYIKEWLEYHKLIGIKKFYIFDNDSTDNLKDILQPYIKSGEVVYEYVTGYGQQCICYNNAIKNYKFKNKYMAFIDLDEFISIDEGTNLIELLDNTINKDNIAGLAIQWCVYGSSGHIEKPAGLVIENYIMRAKGEFDSKTHSNKHIKTICNPRKVLNYGQCHHPMYYEPYYSVNIKGEKITGPFCFNICWEKIRLNHYFTKSFEEYKAKRERGRASTPNLKWDINDFYEADINEIKDESMLKYANIIKKKIG